MAELTMTPVHLLPVMTSEYDVVATERRVYDVVTVGLDDGGNPLAASC